MSGYVLIESGDPFESKSVERHYGLAAALAMEGHEVMLVLVQNGVLAARSGVRTCFEALAQAGVSLLADEFSLRERGLEVSSLAPGVVAAPLDVVIDRLAKGWKALWL